MTRTVRFSELGDPSVLRIEEVPDPEPGPGELVVDVAAIGLNRAESMFRRGTYIHGLLSGQPTIFPAETLPDPWMRSYTLFAMTHDEERLRRAGEFVGAGLRSGDFAPQVDRVFSGLESIAEAHEYLESNVQVGKIVVTVGVDQ